MGSLEAEHPPRVVFMSESYNMIVSTRVRSVAAAFTVGSTLPHVPTRMYCTSMTLISTQYE